MFFTETAFSLILPGDSLARDVSFLEEIKNPLFSISGLIASFQSFHRKMMNKAGDDGSEEYVLEINLISAQGLKVPSSNLRRTQTYALAWVDSSMKLRTRVDAVGAENPTWNDKFLFRVTPEFLSSQTSAVSVEIYAVGCIRDNLVGTVRFLIGNIIPFGSVFGTPAFTAVQVRRPSGRFQGVLNVGAMVIDGSDFTSMTGISAIGYRDLMGERLSSRRRRKPKTAESEFLSESCENSCAESADYSDGGESSTSSSSTASTALKEWNGVRDLTGTKALRASHSVGFLCGLVMQKKIQLRSSGQSTPNLNGSEEKER